MSFNREDSHKSREDLLYERNTFRKGLGTVSRERNELRNRLGILQEMHESALKEMILAGMEGAKEKMWDFVRQFPKMCRVFTGDTTGEKTVIEMVSCRGPGQEKILAHTAPEHVGGQRVYYKQAKPGDVPSYFMQWTLITQDSFTLSDLGEFEPIKKY
jgi:hypothetical protein